MNNKTHHKPVIMIDLGGVYFTDASPVFDKFPEIAGIKHFRKTLWFGRIWHQHATGKTDDKTYWKKFSKKMKLTKKQASTLRREIYNYPPPQKGMVELVRKIKKNYRVVVISSHIPAWAEVLEKKYRMRREFHEIHWSFDHGFDKPSVKFFLSAAKRMHIQPQDCILIDDNKAFLKNVRKAGGRTILFKNAKQVERDLKKMGVILDPIIMIDFGGVYFSGGSRGVARKYSGQLGIPEKEIFNTLIKSGLWNLLARDKITDDEYWRRLRKIFKLDEKTAASMRKDFHRLCRPSKGMPQLVRGLKKNYKVVSLSGNSRERIAHLEKRYGISKRFHEQHYSFHYGYDKPDVRLFLSAVKKMKADPKNCIMIDDMRNFIADVRKTGAKGVVFKNAKQAEAALRKLGVEI